MPRFGLGTWHLGENSAARQTEAGVIREAIDLGIKLIDTAEMYGSGGAEKMLADALGERREHVYIVSKVYPHNASQSGVIAACEHSLKRMNIDYIDLYLLHWPGTIPLEETISGFTKLIDQGKIKDFGVSNFDIDDLTDLTKVDRGQTATNQVLYNLANREAESVVIPQCRSRNIPVMAYCPLDQGGQLLRAKPLLSVARRHEASAAQIALAWLLAQPDIVVIPKCSSIERHRENFAAKKITLTAEDLRELEHAFPAPSGRIRLPVV